MRAAAVVVVIVATLASCALAQSRLLDVTLEPWVASSPTHPIACQCRTATGQNPLLSGEHAVVLINEANGLLPDGATCEYHVSFLNTSTIDFRVVSAVEYDRASGELLETLAVTDECVEQNECKCPDEVTQVIITGLEPACAYNAECGQSFAFSRDVSKVRVRMHAGRHRQFETRCALAQLHFRAAFELTDNLACDRSFGSSDSNSNSDDDVDVSMLELLDGGLDSVDTISGIFSSSANPVVATVDASQSTPMLTFSGYYRTTGEHTAFPESFDGFSAEVDISPVQNECSLGERVTARVGLFPRAAGGGAPLSSGASLTTTTVAPVLDREGSNRGNGLGSVLRIVDVPRPTVTIGGARRRTLHVDVKQPETDTPTAFVMAFKLSKKNVHALRATVAGLHSAETWARLDGSANAVATLELRKYARYTVCTFDAHGRGPWETEDATVAELEASAFDYPLCAQDPPTDDCTSQFIIDHSPPSPSLSPNPNYPCRPSPVDEIARGRWDFVSRPLACTTVRIDKPGKITVTAKDDTGALIVDAKPKLVCTLDGEPAISRKLKARGDRTFRFLVPGDYVCTMSENGFADADVTFTIEKAGKHELTVTMQRLV